MRPEEKIAAVAGNVKVGNTVNWLKMAVYRIYNQSEF
jgi:hypothetical protein